MKIFLVVLLLLLSCVMSDDQVSSIKGIEVYSRKKTIETFQISSLRVIETCPSTKDSLEYMIKEGYNDFFSELYYKKSSVETCNLLFLALECPTSRDTASIISFYKNFLYQCKISPVLF
ncbi:MAG: hypothetical protein NZ853_07960 [Leptospiraceae bacterium]|nr:hypothetical protein [Leptospiraceae bacterium]MDW7976893.1 hypothetical protein [Leptospiraceae bacterium]